MGKKLAPSGKPQKMVILESPAIFAGHYEQVMHIKLGNVTIWESNIEKLLGVNIDKKLNFKYHVTNLCKKANTKTINMS